MVYYVDAFAGMRSSIYWSDAKSIGITTTNCTVLVKILMI